VIKGVFRLQSLLLHHITHVTVAVCCLGSTEQQKLMIKSMGGLLPLICCCMQLTMLLAPVAGE
jgi:hypothetical protein